jgi:hypothetical protein
MAYPYSHRTRKVSQEVFAFKPLGAADGRAVGGSASNQIADMATVTTYTAQPVYGAYRLALHAWGTAMATSNAEIKVRPWVDHGQTIPGPALKMFQIGSATLVTTATVSSHATAAGSIWQIVPGNSGAGANPGSSAQALGPVSHGLAVTVDVNSNTLGKLDFELIIQNQQ